MPHYLAAYDVEAVYPWWELGDQKYSADLYQKSVSYSGARLRECLDGIAAVADAHRRKNLPATFFLVAALVEHAKAELRAILEHPLFDLQCHSYTHADCIQLATAHDAQALRREIVESKRLIEETFGREVRGFTLPAGSPTGLVGQPNLLRALREAGYRYIRSVGLGPLQTIPSPLTQPFWYAQDGCPDMLELALHAWHDNVLSGQPFAIHWPPLLPWGYPAKMPHTAHDMYAAYAPGIEYVIEHDLLTYIPCFHPWSIYRVDRHALHIELLLTHAASRMPVVSCSEFYDMALRQPSRVSNSPS